MPIKKKPGKYSGEPLRARLREWLASHKGVEVEPPSASGILMGTWRLPLLSGGALLVHLPGDANAKLRWFSIHTRFADGARYAEDANRYSGKWNFVGYTDTDQLFLTFTRCVESYERWASVMQQEA